MKETWLRQFDAYPPWLVYTCLTITGIVAVWLLAKVVKWVLHVVLILAVIAAIVLAVVWWLG